jgi:hypothetical protein
MAKYRQAHSKARQVAWHTLREGMTNRASPLTVTVMVYKAKKS